MHTGLLSRMPQIPLQLRKKYFFDSIVLFFYRDLDQFEIIFQPTYPPMSTAIWRFTKKVVLTWKEIKKYN